MDSGELDALLAEVRKRVGEMIAQLDAIDRAALPPIARRMHDDARRNAEQVLTLTSERVLTLLSEACDRAGRELTHDEFLGLLELQHIRMTA